jgi:hypothetical protein
MYTKNAKSTNMFHSLGLLVVPLLLMIGVQVAYATNCQPQAVVRPHGILAPIQNASVGCGGGGGFNRRLQHLIYGGYFIRSSKSI